MNQQERINRYLSQQMDAAEKAHFEAEIAANSDLSESVDLQRDIAVFFKERIPELEAILAEEGAQHFKEATSKDNFSQWKWLLSLLVIPLGLILWWQFANNRVIPSQTLPPIIEKSTLENNAPFIVDTISDTPPLLKEQSPKKPLDKQPDTSPKSTNKKELIASANPVDFQRNPVIESIMAEQVRAKGSLTQLKTPTKDTIFLFHQNIPFKVSGTTTIAPPYTLSIYSNRVFDFENDYKVLSSSLAGTQQNENYRFSFNASIPFPRGLYYLFLQSEQEEEILYISRFKVE